MSDVDATGLRPRMSLPFAMLLPVVLGAAYSGLGQVYGEPFVLGCVLGLSWFVILVVTGEAVDHLLGRLALAMISGAAGVVALWSVWYGLEFGWPALRDLIQQGPTQIIADLVFLSDQYTYTVTGEYRETSYGTSTTKTVWLVETAVYGLSSLMGALAGPRFSSNIRRAARGKAPL